MNVLLTEAIIRGRATEKSFERGLDYYEDGSIHDTAWQPRPNGVILTALCEGSTSDSYRLRVELDASGVRETFCTCPYDWGGDCKHIVAMLMTYLNEPEEFYEQMSVEELLAGVEKEELVALLARLVKNNPDLYNQIELATAGVKLAIGPQVEPDAGAEVVWRADASEAGYRKQIRRLLKESLYDDLDDSYDSWEEYPRYLNDLYEVVNTATGFLQVGDTGNGLRILQIPLEECLEFYQGGYDDAQGDLMSFIDDLGATIAETILNANLDLATRQDLLASLEASPVISSAKADSNGVALIFAALKYGWEELPDRASRQEELEEDEWEALDMLERLRLAVLDGQGRTAEFLQLAEKVDPYQYMLKLIDLGQVETAVAASMKLEDPTIIFSIAKRLSAAGKVDDAIEVAEHGLTLKGDMIYQLADWLAPLAESKRKNKAALAAYRIAYELRPSIDLYRRIKMLSGANWESIRPTLMEALLDKNLPGLKVDVYLEEGEWDQAIAVAESSSLASGRLERVADAALPHRPDWVIRAALKTAEFLIEQVNSSRYPEAARWLGRAKQAYLHQGRAADWQRYIRDLRFKYHRRPALQRELAGL